MTPDLRRLITTPLLSVGLLAAAFVISLALHLVFNTSMVGRVMFFPDDRGERLGVERRPLPRRKDQGDSVALFLDELFLGPVVLHLAPAVPPGSRVQHVIVSGETVYVDLSRHMIMVEGSMPMIFEEILDNLTHNIMYNFPRFKTVVFTIDGQVPGAPYYQPNLRSGDSSGAE